MTNAIALQVRPEDGGLARRVVSRFLDALVTQRPRRAQNLVSSDFTWFGRPVRRADWNGPEFRRFLSEGQLSVDRVRLLPKETLRGMPERNLAEAFGELREEDRIVLADLVRDSKTSTVAFIVDCSQRATLRRVVSTSSFVRFVRLMQVFFAT